MQGRHLQLLSRALEIAKDGSMLDRVCAATPAMLGVTGAAVAVLSENDGGGIVSAAGSGTEAAFDLQFQLGEGPCKDSFDSQTDVLVSDLAQTGPGRWPMFTAEALNAGVAAVFALSAHVGAIRVGVLYLQRDLPGPLANGNASDARMLAELSTSLLLDRQAGLANDHMPLDLVAGWPDRAVIHQATGMVSIQIGSDLAAALARLRAYAFTNEMRLDEVAREVIEDRLRLEP